MGLVTADDADIHRGSPPNRGEWTVDPQKLRFVARRRNGDEYAEVATASGEQQIRLDEPYSVEICPGEITNG